MGKLTNKTVESLVRASIPGKTNDGNGLYLQISKAGSPSWIFRYKHEGKAREMGVGPYPIVSLAEARRLAAEQCRILISGTDPLSARDAAREAKREAERQAQAHRVSFRTLASDYHQAHGTGLSEKWRKNWLRKLELYAFPLIGDLPTGDIQTEEVLRVLQPIWSSKPRTADEVRGQIENVLDAAKARGLREGDNPARWRGHLDNLLSKAQKRKARQREHFPAMRWQDVPALMSELAQRQELSAAAARLLILTGARAQMVRFATRDEFDLDAGIWLLPAERMKMRKAFAIPLAPAVVSLVRSVPRVGSSPYLFAGRGKSGVMHANAIRALLHSLGHTEITRHGFRSSFRDWANECTHYPREVCELALAHDERNQTEAAYSRSDLLEKRRALMNDWAAFCMGEAKTASSG